MKAEFPVMNTIQKLAIATVEQLETLKGKKRDEATLMFWCGAWTAYNEINHPDAAWISRVIALNLASRGYAGAADIAEKARNEPEIPIH